MSKHLNTNTYRDTSFPVEHFSPLPATIFCDIYSITLGEVLRMNSGNVVALPTDLELCLN